MKFSKEAAINAPLDKVWNVYGRDFANIGKWATSVQSSSANTELPPVNNSPVGGRVCATSFGNISEEFTAYDDAKKTFSFKGVFKSPMFKSVVNSSELHSQGEGSTVVKITAEIGLSFTGKLMSPIIKMQLNKALDEILSDLKHYVETDRISPSKVASMKK